LSRLRDLRKRIRRRWKRRPGLIPWLAYQPTRLLTAILRLLPESWMFAVARRIAGLAWWSGRRRRVGRFHIAQALPQVAPNERDSILKRSIGHLGMEAVEILVYSERLREGLLERVSFEPGAREKLESMMGRGAVMMQAHLGAFELGGGALGQLGLKPAFPMRMPNNYYLGQDLVRGREGWGVTLLPRKGAVRRMMAHLKEGGNVVLATDQNAHHAPIFVPWFGVPAATERAAASLVLKLGTPLLVFWCLRDAAPGRWIMGCEILEEGGSRTAATEQAVLELNERIHHCLENVIKRHPEQYLWIHDRYRTRPPTTSNAHD
jgi:KDO2-lipid IV(A) lauroyltransferase